MGAAADPVSFLFAGKNVKRGFRKKFFVIRSRKVLDRLAGMTEKAFAGMEAAENT